MFPTLHQALPSLIPVHIPVSSQHTLQPNPSSPQPIPSTLQPCCCAGTTAPRETEGLLLAPLSFGEKKAGKGWEPALGELLFSYRQLGEDKVDLMGISSSFLEDEEVLLPRAAPRELLLAADQSFAAPCPPLAADIKRLLMGSRWLPAGSQPGGVTKSCHLLSPSPSLSRPLLHQQPLPHHAFLHHRPLLHP